MQYEYKKQLERLLVDLFRETYIDFPEGKIQESESPDFIIKQTVKNTIGVELTRLYPESQIPLTQDEKEIHELQDELISMVREQFEDKYAVNCFIKILFDKSKPVLPERMLSSSVKISRLLVNAALSLKKGKPEQLLITKNLPEGIRSMLVFTHPELGYSVWERSNNLGIPSDLSGDIQHSINKKDAKLKLYEKKHLNQYWLLITTDRLCQQKPVNIQNLLMKSEFYSDFDKVFILELFGLKTYSIL